MKKASILAIWFVLFLTGCESDGDAHRSAMVPTPLAEGVISDATSARGPGKGAEAKEVVTSSPFDQALELESGVYGLSFGATTDEVMKWYSDNHMAVANPTEKDVKEAARNAVGRIKDLKEAYDFEALLNDLWVEDFSEFYLGKTARGPRGPNYPPVALIWLS